MKITGFLTILSSVTLINLSQAAITISSVVPSTGAIADSTVFGGTGSRIFDDDANNNHARGNGFSLGASTLTNFQIDAISIESNGDTFNNDSLTLFIYEGTSAQWNTGTGHTNGSTDYYVGTTVTPLYQETQTLNGAASANDWITFELSTPLVVNENSDFGFFFTYDQGSGPTSLFYQESGQAGRTSITTTAHGTSGARRMNFYVTGVPIPEPSSFALIAVGGLTLLRRRRS